MSKETVKKAIDISNETVMKYLEMIEKDDLIQKIAKKIKIFYVRHMNDIFPEDSYQKSYNDLLEYGKKCNNKHQYIILAHAVYGWMPTILEINFNIENDIESAINTLLKLKTEKIDSVRNNDVIESLRTVAKFTNNSFVGASKFLHFICPNKFAIWDSTILNVLKKDKFNLKFDDKRKHFFSKTSANSMKNFIGYQLIMQEALTELKKEYSEITLRSVEKVLFYSVPKKQRKKSKDR